MRKDMAKMLVETHRSTAAVTYKDTRKRGNDSRGFENAPKREKMKGRYGYDTKEFGENFPPLVGFLRKNVGRKWDDVYSELCASLKGGGTVIAHTKLHLFRDFLIEKPYWIDGKPHNTPEWSWKGPTPLSADQPYVDQKGFLRITPQNKKRPRNTYWDVDNRVIVDKNKQYRKVNGVWFEILLKKLPRSPLETGLIYYDVFLKREIRGYIFKKPNYFGIIPRPEWCWIDSKGSRHMCQKTLEMEYPEAGLDRHNYAYSKRQLSSKEIEKLGLKDATMA